MKKLGLGLLLLVLGCCGMLAAAESAAFNLLTPENNSEVKLLRPVQEKFVTMPREERIKYYHDEKCRKELRSQGWYPQPVVFTWQAPAGSKDFILTISPRQDFKDAQTLKLTEAKAEIDNLMIATTYYWKVTANTEKGASESPVWQFRTADRAPRLIRVDNVGNVRDLGGRIGLNGRRVKQNLVFRSAGLNDNAKTVYGENTKLLAENPGLREHIQQVKARMEEINKNKRNAAAYVPFTVNKEWTLFQPQILPVDMKDPKMTQLLQDVAAMRAIPATFMGAAAESAHLTKGNKMVFSVIQQFKPLVLVQEFTAERAGLMLMSCGAYKYWRLYLNGELVCDRINGNLKKPATINDYQFALPVRQGKNFLAVVIAAGDSSWTIAYSGMTVNKENCREITRAVTKNMADYIQGMAMEVTGYEPGKTRITPETSKFWLETLKIKSDIDLRSDRECHGMNGSPLGPTVTWFHYSSSAYAGMASKYGKEQFTKVFKVFLDEKNYPIDFHCIAGQDRTGAVAFILNGLLGVAEEELYLDWEVTGFWNPSTSFCHKYRFNKLVEVFAKLPGNTLNEKIENYVLGLGFTKEDINKFREFMLEPAK